MIILKLQKAVESYRPGAPGEVQAALQLAQDIGLVGKDTMWIQKAAEIIDRCAPPLPSPCQ